VSRVAALTEGVWYDCVIDEGGESWLPHAPAYARRLGYPNPDFDLASFAVRNLGHARVVLRGRAAHVAFRPSMTNAVTLAGVFLTVFEGCPERVALAHHDDEGAVRHELFGSAQNAFWRMEDLVLAKPDSAWPRFVSEQTDLLRLDPAVAGRMLALIRLWQLTCGEWTPSLLERFADAGVAKTTMVAGSAARSHRLVIEACGAGYTFAEEPWQRSLAVGQDLDDQPDRDYGAWAADGYRQAAGRGEPQIESVNALIRTPGCAARRSRYARLVLPWRGSRRHRVITSTSFIKASALVG
jgi:hypothetical protein